MWITSYTFRYCILPYNDDDDDDDGSGGDDDGDDDDDDDDDDSSCIDLLKRLWRRNPWM